jgi:ABC-2 type transport system ATP-binding protein
MARETAIATFSLAKHYGDVRAVDGIDLCVKRGEIYGFLGRNGAGKTTTIRMMLGLIQPTAGEVHLLGKRIKPGGNSFFAHVGYLVEDASAYANLTVRENLDIQRRLTRSPREAVPEVIALLRLGEYSNRLSGHLSLGNKQRLALARALLHNPNVLLLDEPVNGLDPAGIVEIRDLLRRLATERGVTVFLSSHILSEVAHIADRIGIVHDGRLLEETSIDELSAQSEAYLEVATSNADQAIPLLTQRLGIQRIERAANSRLRVFGHMDSAGAIARLLVEEGLEVTHLCRVEEDLEAYFMRMTGGN